MYKKIFISIIAIAISIISGVGGLQYVKDNSVEIEVANDTNTEENIVESATIEEVKETEESQENILDEKEEKIIENNLDIAKNNNSRTANKETKVIEKEKTSGKKDNITEAKSNVETKDSTTKCTQDNTKKVETQKVEQKPKEEYIYNDAATKKMISDIDAIAKRNPDLWGKNGEKLYKIEKCPSLVGKNYMYPYNYGQVEGKVLNVYSVTFLVYAVDYKKDGFATETRYYIDITNFKK